MGVITELVILVLAAWVGIEVVSKVPQMLHTPLMSASNAISGITVVGALTLAGQSSDPTLATILGSLAVGFASINVFGGYIVTDRMLSMFKKKGSQK